MKDINTIEAEVEALIFAGGDSVNIKRLCEVLETDEKTMNNVLKMMMHKYDNDQSRGIHLIKLEDNYQLCTKREYYESVKALTEKKRRASLSNASLETLSVIAYNQPVTRSSIEFIRGVNSDGSVNRLLEYGLIEEKGRLDAPGRPILFGTSEEFLRVFNLESLSQLPDVELEYNFSSLNGELTNGEQTTIDLGDGYEDFYIDIQTDVAKEGEQTDSTDTEVNG